MKDTILVIKHTLIGLLVAMVIYPVIHESGHILATLFSNGKVISFSLWPLPSVGCIVDSTNTAALAVTSLSGIIFPILIAGMFRWTNGVFRYAALVFIMIAMLSTLIGMMTAILRMIGVVMPNDDITTFIDLTGSSATALFFMLTFFALTVIQASRIKPKMTLLKTLKLA